MPTLSNKHPFLEHIRPIEWAEVFQTWKEAEATQKSWKKHWQERGFDSWDEWRKAYAAPLSPESLSWNLFRLKNPPKQSLFFYGVPSRGWIQKAYQGKSTLAMSELLKSPLILQNNKVAAIKDNFPPKTTLTGLIHNGHIVIYEGMHRVSAMASWDKDKLFTSQVFMALAAWDKEQLPVVGGNRKDKNGQIVIMP